ncbi:MULTISPECIES: isochorismatase family cysteine hydrolase [Streptomyces]|uniref:Isochorismatase family cysteine hydrolase n=1 Tax=Streptomyces ramulosus TaxID=47762 RepID=A0ABW1FBR3_9ACTN
MTDALTFTPHRTALLLMDLQAGILGLLPDPAELVQRAKQAREAATAAGIQVVYVRVAFTEEDYKGISEYNKTFAPAAAHHLFAEGSPETVIAPEVQPGPHDAIFTKTRTGAFSTTHLDAFLRERGIDTLVLAGVSTTGVILSTVRDAADRDYRVIVLSDVCADPDATAHHTLLESVFPSQADLLDGKSFADSLIAPHADGAGPAT